MKEQRKALQMRNKKETSEKKNINEMEIGNLTDK